MTERDEVSELACLLIMLHGADAPAAALRLGAAHDPVEDKEGHEFWAAVTQTVLRLLEAVAPEKG